MKKSNSIYLLLVAITYIAGCAKDGATGPAGQNGTNGTNGNANVSSRNFTVNPGDWQTASSTVQYVELTVPEINQAIMDSGMVIVYWEVFGYESMLPQTTYQGTWSTTVEYEYKTGIVHIDIISNTTLSAPTITNNFRVVIASAHLRLANPNINWNNYAEVKATLNLKD